VRPCAAETHGWYPAQSCGRSVRPLRHRPHRPLREVPSAATGPTAAPSRVGEESCTMLGATSIPAEKCRRGGPFRPHSSSGIVVQTCRGAGCRGNVTAGHAGPPVEPDTPHSPQDAPGGTPEPSPRSAAAILWAHGFLVPTIAGQHETSGVVIPPDARCSDRRPCDKARPQSVTGQPLPAAGRPHRPVPG